MAVEINIEGILFGLDGLKGVHSFKAFKPIAEAVKLKDPEKAWETIQKAKKGAKKKGK